MNNDNAFLPYTYMLNDINNFKRSGTSYDNQNNFNIYDTPSSKYFKILFYFGSDSEFTNSLDSAGSGLLAPTWEIIKSNDDKYYEHNSAWAYLKMNDENERAEKLEQFVTLLSDINTNSPWYFSTIGGLQEALERKVAEDGKLEITDKKITITCLPDAVDNRIGTLLDLYRDITWSWTLKKEIIPANLRKFDMAIYLFDAPDKVGVTYKYLSDKIDGISSEMSNDDTYNSYNVDLIEYIDNYRPSYKMIEFHDCEFNYNSIKSAWSELNNAEGISPKYTIDITFGDCYEISYNNIMMRTIGDVILTDMINGSNIDSDYKSNAQEDDDVYESYTYIDSYNRSSRFYTPQYNNRVARLGSLNSNTFNINNSNDIEYKKVYEPGFLSTAAGELVGHTTAAVKKVAKRLLLGNIYSYSLTNMSNQLSEAAQGNLIKTGLTVNQYIKNSKKYRDKPIDDNKRIYKYLSYDRKAKRFNGTIVDPNSVSVENNIYKGDVAAIDSTGRKQYANNEADRSTETGNIYEGDVAAVDNTGRRPIVINKASKKLGNIFSASTIANNL
jgi:hypothetical protein